MHDYTTTNRTQDTHYMQYTIRLILLIIYYDYDNMHFF